MPLSNDYFVGPVISWVFWGDAPTYQFSGQTPPNAQVLWENTDPDNSNNSHLMWYMPGYDLGVQVYPDMIHSTPGSPDYLPKPGTNAYAKECTTINLQPDGIGALVTNGWDMIQNRWVHEFIDGSNNPDCYDSNWIPDGPWDWRNTHSPDSDDNLYGVDAPGIGKSDGAINKYEVHQNYQVYETLDGVICSDTNCWHFEAAWASGPPQTIVPYGLDSGTIALPTSAQY
jgi:hypothetical protein